MDRTFGRIWFQSSSAVCISSVASNLVHPVPCNEDVPWSNSSLQREAWKTIFVCLSCFCICSCISLHLCPCVLTTLKACSWLMQVVSSDFYSLDCCFCGNGFAGLCVFVLFFILICFLRAETSVTDFSIQNVAQSINVVSTERNCSVLALSLFCLLTQVI